MMNYVFTAAYTIFLLYLITAVISEEEASEETENSEANQVSSETKSTTLESVTSSTYLPSSAGALYKLYYFDFRGRGEPIRLLLNYAAEPFQDFRIDRSEWLTKYKNNTLYGHVPVLEIKSDGRVMAESYAISRFLAKN
uniref:glutathione transferase n=1 Tax=Ditylenchus dipsaci TaxID=166011 RepID=A0A915D5H7_9BILA